MISHVMGTIISNSASLECKKAKFYPEYVQYVYIPKLNQYIFIVVNINKCSHFIVSS